MRICPHCQTGLVRAKTKGRSFSICGKCGGRSVPLSILRKTGFKNEVNHLWWLAKEKTNFGGRPCPVCHFPMVGISLAEHGQTSDLDLCKACYSIWFDAHEYEAIPALPPEEKPALPPEAREIEAIEKVRFMAENMPDDSDEEPLRFQYAVFASLGLPVEYENFIQSTPWITYLLILLCSLVSIPGFLNSLHPKDIANHFDLIPEFASRLGRTALFTSFFVHANIFHWLSNMYFLFTFGDNVEDMLGKVRFLLLLILSSVGAYLAYGIFDPGHDFSWMGISGMISGLIFFYASAFPKARLALLIGRRLGRLVWMNVRIYALFWIVIQVLGVSLKIEGFNSAFFAGHLGGAAAGLLFWFATRNEFSHSEE